MPKNTTLCAFAILLMACGVAQAIPIVFTATLSGAGESPSAGTGFADVIYDPTAQTLQVDITFSGLSSPTTASHIHAATPTPGTGTAGVATTTPSFAGFPSGVTSGSYQITLDLTLLSSYNSAYVTAHGGTASSAETALIAAMELGETYLNIHTTDYPGGEIRGFLTEQVPDTAPTAVLLILGVAGVAVFGRMRLTVVAPKT